MGLQKRKTKASVWYWIGEYRWTDAEGHRQRRTTWFGPVPDLKRAVAKKLEAVWRAQLIEERHLPRRPAMHVPTLRSFQEAFLGDYRLTHRPRSIRRYEDSFKALGPVLGDLPLDAITEVAVQRYKRLRLEAGVTPGGINPELECLRQVLNTAVVWGACPPFTKKPVRLLKAPEGRTRFLTLEEEDRLLAACHPTLRRPVVCALHTGLRLDEVQRMRWVWVDWAQETLRIPGAETKGGHTDTIPLNADVLAVLREIAPGTPDPMQHVFLTTYGHPWRGLRKRFDRAVKQAGLSGVSFHVLRHTFGSRLVQRGEDLRRVQLLLRHRSLKETQRYTHLADEHLRAAVQKLERPPR